MQILLLILIGCHCNKDALFSIKPYLYSQVSVVAMGLRFTISRYIFTDPPADSKNSRTAVTRAY